MATRRKMIYRTLQWFDFSMCKHLFYKIFDMDEDKYFFKAWKNRHKTASYIVINHGSIVGFVLVDTEFCIQYVAVDSQFRGRQVGSELMKRVCNALSDAPSICLNTANDPRLKLWYAKFGFEENHKYLDSNKEYIGTGMIRHQIIIPL